MEIIIGKYTLESLTTGMYKDPFILYREYIQNATDSIDEAAQKGILSNESGCIKIVVNDADKEIIIEDNGMGIDSINAYKILTDIGNSKKKYTTHKGFRGIGRLGGLSYCEKLVFETSYMGENKKTIVEFDSNRLKELLIPGKFEDYTMVDVIREITTESFKEEEEIKHYFRVVLKGVSTKHKLLDFDRVENYLCQVAPIPFNKNFIVKDKIYNELDRLGLEKNEYILKIGKSKQEFRQIFKPYKRKFYADISKKIEDKIEDVEFKLIRDDYLDKNVALVWYGKSNLYGTIVDDNVKGLRVRKSGILIGDRFLLNDIFKEERFNGWIQGEVLVFDDKIIPNARRDDFEKNDEYLFLIEELKKVVDEINSEIREVSKIRNQKKDGLYQTSLNDLKEACSDLEKTIPAVKTESLDEEFKGLYEQLEKEDDDNDILNKIEVVLRGELDDREIIRIIMDKIKNAIDKN
ncbi:ATP-binding protein [Clostridium sp. DJ247]|uniref:ATP-binding protein n=1 Tax=Clostridium sp. DJ247 TaxID=2726188 RepID=UPI0016247439|nr:ATP-binding protein [Clostridium sp. DJ247]MBC2579168.1 hypothetical protein [Clostridium sp. DJ247]